MRLITAALILQAMSFGVFAETPQNQSNETATETTGNLKSFQDKSPLMDHRCHEDMLNSFYIECRVLRDSKTHAEKVLCCPAARMKG